MCLAYPGKIIGIKGDSATVDYGSEKRVAKLIERKYKVGDYVVVQGKVVIEKIPTRDAVKWLETIKNGTC
jgi:hydrogenase maturation factor